jgi:hypothetical protein
MLKIATEYWTMDKIRAAFERAGGSLATRGILPDDEESYWKSFENDLRSGSSTVKQPLAHISAAVC